MAVCRRCGNQMADTAAACPACGELRYQQPAAAPQYGQPQQQQPQYPQQPQQPQYGQPQQHQYAQPQPAQPQFAMPAMPVVTADEAKGFVGALMDFSFTSFITTKLVKFLYILALAFAALAAVGMLISGLLQLGNSFTFMTGIISIVLAPIIFAFSVVYARVAMEIIIVIFRGAEHLAEIAKSVRR